LVKNEARTFACGRGTYRRFAESASEATYIVTHVTVWILIFSFQAAYRYI